MNDSDYLTPDEIVTLESLVGIVVYNEVLINYNTRSKRQIICWRHVNYILRYSALAFPNSPDNQIDHKVYYYDAIGSIIMGIVQLYSKLNVYVFLKDNIIYFMKRDINNASAY